MTQLHCMAAGACSTTAARAELGGYALQLVLRAGLLVERFPGVLVRATQARDPVTVASAALAWCRGDGLLCGSTAAWLAGCSRARAPDVHVLRPPGRSRSGPPGIVIHHGTVPQAQRTTLCGLQATRLDRSVAALLCVAGGGHGFAVAEEAAALPVAPERSVFRELVRARIAERPDPRYRARGDRLARLITGRTRSRAACAVLRTLVEHDLPVPRQWHPVCDHRGREQYRLEFAWPAARVALELSGACLAGAGVSAYEPARGSAPARGRAPEWDGDPGRDRDLARDADLAMRGWSLVRVDDPDGDWLGTISDALRSKVAALAAT